MDADTDLRASSPVVVSTLAKPTSMRMRLANLELRRRETQRSVLICVHLRFLLSDQVAGLGIALSAAHLSLMAPISRYGGGVLKVGPCGAPDGPRNVNELEPGTTIEVEWNEYIDHPGHFRIAFDEDGDADGAIQISELVAAVRRLPQGC